MFESSGEITPPWGVPPVVRVRTPLSSAPAFNHLSIIFRTTPSVTRWSRNLRRFAWSMVSNEDTTDYPFPRRSDFSGDHPQAPSLPRMPPGRDQRADSARRAVVVGGAARREPIPHPVSLDGLVWGARHRGAGRG